MEQRSLKRSTYTATIYRGSLYHSKADHGFNGMLASYLMERTHNCIHHGVWKVVQVQQIGKRTGEGKNNLDTSLL